MWGLLLIDWHIVRTTVVVGSYYMMVGIVGIGIVGRMYTLGTYQVPGTGCAHSPLKPATYFFTRVHLTDQLRTSYRSRRRMRIGIVCTYLCTLHTKK